MIALNNFVGLRIKTWFKLNMFDSTFDIGEGNDCPHCSPGYTSVPS